MVAQFRLPAAPDVTSFRSSDMAAKVPPIIWKKVTVMTLESIKLISGGGQKCLGRNHNLSNSAVSFILDW